MTRHSLIAAPLAVFILIALATGDTALAQRTWTDKPYVEWSEKECSRVLTDSPWAKHQMVMKVIVQAAEFHNRGAQFAQNPGLDAVSQITYTAQLWSALPIRQAAVRRHQLRPEVRFDLPVPVPDAATLLADRFEDSIVFHVLYDTNVGFIERDLVNYWQMRLVDDYKHEVYLITSSGRFVPTDVQVGKNAARDFTVRFPRTANGRPVVRSTDKSFALDFYSPALAPLAREEVRLEFVVKELATGGAPIF